MAVHPSGLFDYTLNLKRGSSGSWIGQAEPGRDAQMHPGIAGEQPHVTLKDGVITLRSTKGEPTRAPEILPRRPEWFATALIHRVGRLFSPSPTPPSLYHADWGPPSEVSFRIGNAVEAVVEEDDVLRVCRWGTGDLALTLHRRGEPQVGLGAISSVDLGQDIGIDEDPRVNETCLYGVLGWLSRPGTALFWLDTSDPHLESVIQELSTTPALRLAVAIAGPDPGQRRRLNNRVAGGRAHGRASCWYFDVDGRFTSREQWLDYLRSLPETRPPDLWVRIAVGGVATVLREDEYAFSSPWHLFVWRVFRDGIPGELSRLAMVREHDAITRSIVIESTVLLGSGDLSITK
jgi:hypothetical protein